MMVVFRLYVEGPRAYSIKQQVIFGTLKQAKTFTMKPTVIEIHGTRRNDKMLTVLLNKSCLFSVLDHLLVLI